MHLRSIMAFVSVAMRFESQISIRFEGEVADGKSPWALLGLGIVPGSKICILANGSDEERAIRDLRILAENDFQPSE
ncbi:HPr family phosphocarrier protein, partial [bacterium]|nr:HPr family phosphocarrier protein [bacterium]